MWCWLTLGKGLLHRCVAMASPVACVPLQFICLVLWRLSLCTAILSGLGDWRSHDNRRGGACSSKRIPQCNKPGTTSTCILVWRASPDWSCKKHCYWKCVTDLITEDNFTVNIYIFRVNLMMTYCVGRKCSCAKFSRILSTYILLSVELFVSLNLCRILIL